MPNWTKEQKQAIYQKNSNLLVAAAAGSGKTAVLVERIINKAVNENIDIDKLLVVTFTNAAASEMKERVLKAIYEKLEEDPENENLQRQITLLNVANICTIDSFCLDVVKNNFYELDNVSPNFRIADTPEIELLKQEILEELFEDKYLANDKDFIELVNTYTSYRDDAPLKDLILNIYNYICSSPFPEKWLDEKFEMFNIENKLDQDFSKTVWGNILLKEVNDELNDDIAILSECYNNIADDEDLEDFANTIESDIKQLNTLKKYANINCNFKLENNIDNESTNTDNNTKFKDNINNENGFNLKTNTDICINYRLKEDLYNENGFKNINIWDKCYEIANNIKFVTWPRKKVESEIKDEVKQIRDTVKKKFNKTINKIFISNSREANQDIFDMYGILKKLENLILEFDTNFSKTKRDKNIVDFTDIEHLALNILIKGIDNKGNIIKSDVAKKYTEKFEEIAIDEYQDSNLVQEYILLAVSRGNNMFMVGDVKQSIYRFRQSMPKLFLDKYKNFDFINDDDLENFRVNENNYNIENFRVNENNYNIENSRVNENDDNLKISNINGNDIKNESEISDLDVNNSRLKNGRKIQLFKNFRSRDNVLDFTNLIFKDIMSSELGEVEYTKEEYLNFGAEDYKNSNQNLKTEIDIIDVKKENKYNSNSNSDVSNADMSNGDISNTGISNGDISNIGISNGDINNTGISNVDMSNANKGNADINIENASEEDDALDHFENIEIEAKYVAKKVKKLIDEKFQIYDRKNESFRDIQYKDIAILLRSTKNKANIYEQELINLEIPVFSDSNQEYLDSIEIQTIMSILRIIDNPMQDIPLVTVLRSNIGGFTDDELVEIRLADKFDNFYTCMQKAGTSVNPNLKQKISRFLNQLDEWRKKQEYLGLDELIWKIYSDTGYYNYVGCMPNGLQRQANLKMLFERAKKYETASFKGLYNFINFIDKLKVNSGDLGSAKIIGENDDVVRIMSIHKSKGLEFPVVILVNTNKQFNEQELKNSPVLLHQEMGIGAKYINYNAQVQFDTLSREAVKEIIKNESISEEMRVLYVALTRAKEKLIITGVTNDIEKKQENINLQTETYKKENGKINHILVKKYKSYLDWIILVYAYEKEQAKDLIDFQVIKAKEILKDTQSENKAEQNNDYEKLMEQLNTSAVSEDQIKKLKEKIEFKYKDILATKIPTKSSVTQIKEMSKSISVKMTEENLIKQNKEVHDNTIIQNDIEFEKPQFLQEEKEHKITSTERGTLVHLCMQKLNPKEDYDLQKVQDLINNMALKNIITEKEAESINAKQILEFTNTEIWQSLKTAKEIQKEKPFYINIPAKNIIMQNLESANDLKKLENKNDLQNLENKINLLHLENVENIENSKKNIENSEKPINLTEIRDLSEDILVQGIIDLYFIDKDDNLILLDYKTDYINIGEEDLLIKRYKDQLQLYKEALEEALSKKVYKTFIYSVYLCKTLEICF